VFEEYSLVSCGVNFCDSFHELSVKFDTFQKLYHEITHFPHELGWSLLIADRLMCEKLTIFPYADDIVEFCVKLAFLSYSQVQD